jgi:tripartite-type tricarboxylate transporter receptor subunit TctC
MSNAKLAFLFLTSALFAATLPASGQVASPYPDKPLRLVVPFSAGGGADILARAVGQKLSEAFGKPVIVDNRGGGSGIPATDMVAKAAPNGHTLLFTSSVYATNPGFFTTLPFDPYKDFAPITQATSQPYVLGVHPSVAANSVKELIALAKSRPGQFNYASGGDGGAPHLGMELFKHLTATNIMQVPYKGGGPALLALLSGEVAMLLSSVPSTIPQVKAGKVRALAVSGRSRAPALPDLPTVAEAGVPEYEVTSWYGVLAPAKTSTAIIAKLRTEIVKALNTNELRTQLTNDGAELVGSTPDAFAAYIHSEIPKWAKVMKTAGVRTR